MTEKDSKKEESSKSDSWGTKDKDLPDPRELSRGEEKKKSKSKK